MSSGLSLLAAKSLIKFCESLENVDNPFVSTGKARDDVRAREDRLLALKKQLVNDPGNAFITMSPTQLETAVQRVLIYAPDQYLMSPEAELGEIDWYKLLKIQSAVKDKSKTAANAKEKERIDFNKEALPHIASIAARREQYLIAQKKKDLESHQAIVTEKKTAANIIKRSTKGKRSWQSDDEDSDAKEEEKKRRKTQPGEQSAETEEPPKGYATASLTDAIMALAKTQGQSQTQSQSEASVALELKKMEMENEKLRLIQQNLQLELQIKQMNQSSNQMN